MTLQSGDTTPNITAEKAGKLPAQSDITSKKHKEPRQYHSKNWISAII